MKKKITKTKELENKIAELTDLLKRTQADFINYKTRVDQETKQLLEYGSANIIMKLLPVLDSFELALKNSSDPERYKKGIEMVYAQFFEILKQEGLTAINAKGQKFDPYKHEVLLKEKSNQPPETIIEDLQKGYEYKGKVIRHSKVKISQ